MDNILDTLAVSTIQVNRYATSHKLVVWEVQVFEQTWGSTALGFDGWGGSTLTSAWTHVVRDTEGRFHVFFNGRFAYRVDSLSEKFAEDLGKRCLKGVSGSSAYRKGGGDGK